ncbi:MAG: hypothetical protein K2L00_09325 [Muribaculaceae bacterium]|nr:hypothetical protein [Muribaculaceae bacterium]
MAATTYTKEAAEKVQPGVLNLMNVSVKDSGRSVSSVYNHERLQLFEPFEQLVKEGLLRASASSVHKLQTYMNDLKKPGGVTMIPITGQTQLYNSFDGDLRNVVAVAKADKRYEKAWERLITSLEVSSRAIREQLGREVRVGCGYNWHYSNFAELLFAPLTVTDIKEDYSRAYRDYRRYGQLTMDASTRINLCDLFFGKETRLPHLHENLPEDRNLKTEDFEHATATDLMTLEGVALNGSMLGANGSISAMTVKKVKAKTGISDFAISLGQWPLDRVELLCLTYFTLLNARKQSEKSGIDVKMLAMFTVNHMAKWLIGPIFSSFMPEMQGFNKSWTSASYAPRIAGAVHYLLKEAKDEWMDLSNFRMQLLCCSIEGDENYSYLKLFSEEGRRKGSPVRKADKEKGIADPRPIAWGEEVGMTFALHWIKYLCAMGILKLAMDPGANDDDPMEGMRFARLTPLGRYALGLAVNYIPKAPEGSLDVDFDAHNAILTIDAKSPFQMFIDRIARRISPTRFHLSVDSLLKGCRNADDLNQRIDNLSSIIDPAKEPALKAIMDEARKHTYCAARDGGYSLLRLRSDLPQFREVILTDKELREMTIFAGPALVLVKTHKIERFNALCASHGFLLD